MKYANTHLELPITLAYGRGAYTVNMKFGSQQAGANVLLDTGSSSLALRARAYRPDLDTQLQATSLLQHIRYGQGSWLGPVLKTPTRLGADHHGLLTEGSYLAYMEDDGCTFFDADGILGLAYESLNPAFDLAELASLKRLPRLSWPWPFADKPSVDQPNIDATLADLPKTHVPPFFSQIEQHGIRRDRFALKIRRPVARVRNAGPIVDEQLLDDPHNNGLWMIGGALEHGLAGRHHSGPFTSVQVVHDRYYNTDLMAIQIGDGPTIHAERSVSTTDQPLQGGNSLIDSGCSFLVLAQSLYDALLAVIEQQIPNARQLIQQSQNALTGGSGLRNDAIDPARWPSLHLMLAGPDGKQGRITCHASDYWPQDALQQDRRLCLLRPPSASWKQTSILGLPVLANKLCVFDRSRHVNGVIHIAAASWHS